MLIRIDPSAEEPLFSQIADALRQQVAAGALGVGTKLPPAKLLAEQLGVNLHTVLRAYQELRDEGLVELRRGRGATITAQANGVEALVDDVDALLAKGQQLGVSLESLVALLQVRAGC